GIVHASAAVGGAGVGGMSDGAAGHAEAEDLMAIEIDDSAVVQHRLELERNDVGEWRGIGGEIEVHAEIESRCISGSWRCNQGEECIFWRRQRGGFNIEKCRAG